MGYPCHRLWENETSGMRKANWNEHEKLLLTASCSIWPNQNNNHKLQLKFPSLDDSRCAFLLFLWCTRLRRTKHTGRGVPQPTLQWKQKTPPPVPPNTSTSPPCWFCWLSVHRTPILCLYTGHRRIDINNKSSVRRHPQYQQQFKGTAVTREESDGGGDHSVNRWETSNTWTGFSVPWALPPIEASTGRHLVTFVGGNGSEVLNEWVNGGRVRQRSTHPAWPLHAFQHMAFPLKVATLRFKSKLDLPNEMLNSGGQRFPLRHF